MILKEVLVFGSTKVQLFFVPDNNQHKNIQFNFFIPFAFQEKLLEIAIGIARHIIL
jgi:hypothetical protein